MQTSHLRCLILGCIGDLTSPSNIVKVEYISEDNPHLIS